MGAVTPRSITGGRCIEPTAKASPAVNNITAVATTAKIRDCMATLLNQTWMENNLDSLPAPLNYRSEKPNSTFCE
jgi:hypothetical protein